MKLNAKDKKSVDDVGFAEPLPGRYHVVVSNVDASCVKFPKAIVVEFEVLAGTTPGQVGRKHLEFLSLAEAAQDRLLRFALATGILLPGEERDVVFSESTGKQVIIELEDHTYQGKTTRRIPFAGFWPIGHKDHLDVPINQEALKAHKEGKRLATSAGNWTAQHTDTQAEPAAATGTHALGGDDWTTL